MASASLEAPLLKGPYERLKRTVRERKSTMEEVTAAVHSLEPTACEKVEPLQALDGLLNKLHSLKRKLEETSQMEQTQVAQCRARVEHMAQLAALTASSSGSAVDSDEARAWHSKQLERMLVDHMLRSGYYDAAAQLADAAGLELLVDAHVFLDARRVMTALQAHDCAPALAWCATHAPRLKKLKSPLQFMLHRVQFLELVRQQQHLNAIQYARSHLSQWAGVHMKELQQAMATLAFRQHDGGSPYKHLFDEKQWEELMDVFHKENNRINHLTLKSLLTIYLQAGLSALKTPLGVQDNCNVEDPLHLESFRSLAAPLPFAKHLQSKLVCHLTRELMNENNPPMVLPNGYVYSLKAMEEMSHNNHGKVKCPRTGLECQFTDLVKAFIC